MNPPRQSGSLHPLLAPIRFTRSSGTSLPGFHQLLRLGGRSHRRLQCACRSISPVEMCGPFRQRSAAASPAFLCRTRATKQNHGRIAPARLKRGLKATSAATSADTARTRGEAFVVAHDQLRFDLVDGVHRHADHDQQRSAAKEEASRPVRPAASAENAHR